jgi:hypothetical protein
MRNIRKPKNGSRISGGQKKKMVLEIEFEDTAALDTLFYKMRNGMFPIGPVYIQCHGAVANGHIVYNKPLQEPRIEFTDATTTLYYKANFE